MGEVRRQWRLKQPPWWRREESWRRYRSAAFQVAHRRRTPAWRRGLGLAALSFCVVAVAGASMNGGNISAAVGSAASTIRDLEQARFTLCLEADVASCVIDGDTFRYEGRTIRIADIDTPEVRDYRCLAEKQRGEAATRRLVSLMNAGPFTLAPYERKTDRYGRLLRIVTREGKSLGRILVEEGFARVWDGARHPWCG
jgi:micrococcal nuclease